MARGQFILENKAGQVVRTLHVDSPQIHLVYRKDTKRIEAYGTVESLKARQINFDLLTTVKVTDLKKSPHAIGKIGRLRYVTDVESVSPSVRLHKDDQKDFKVFLGYSSAAHLAVIGVLLILGVIVNTFFAKPKAENHVVTIYKEDIPKLLEQEQRQVVEASQQKVKPVAQNINEPRDRHAKVSNRNVTKNSSHKKANVRGAPGAAGLGDGPGVLGVLGAADRRATGRGGYNVANAKSTGGFGSAKHGGGYGSHGSGGINRAIFGSGMIAGNPGPGSMAPGAGGYGTKGVGGGGRTGYGKLATVGGTNGYFQPLESEAQVTGGLDQDQIAEVIRRHMGEVVNCYEQGLQRQPNLAGRVNTKFVIGGSGSVTSAQINHSSLKSASVESCVVSRLRSWKFPRPVNNVDVRVSYPFAFRRVGQG